MGRTTLAIYLGKRFVLGFLGAIAVCVALIFFVEMLENLRRASDHDVGMGVVVALTLYRIPTLSEQVLPFATLFAAISSFLMLSRSLELVVVRAVGASVWQFIAPALILAFTIGVLGTVAFNPLAAHLKGQYRSLFAASFTSEQASSFGVFHGQEIWLRQDGVDGPSVLHSSLGDPESGVLHNVSAFLYDEENHFVERVEASRAEIGDGHWRLYEAIVIEPGRPPQRYPTYLLSTYLTPEQIRERIAAADAVPFWELPHHARIAERTGISSLPYRLQFQTLLARPLLLCAMVLIGATVSLRVFRFGNVGQMILGGVVAGFMLYVVTKLAGDLATAGAITPVVAAWAPPVIAVLWGTTLLLFQEDG